MWGDRERQEHHHAHGEGCHCAECEAKKDEPHEQTSAEMAGGVAVGVNGHIHGFNADAEARLDKAMIEVAKWIDAQAGYFLGHVKMAVYTADEGITLNLIDLSIGVEHHGTMSPVEKADYNFMAAVVDVDAGELKHRMLHALEDSGVDICFEDHECHCHDHDHEHHHHDGEECHCHEGHSHGHHDHDHNEEDQKEEKKSFWDKVRRKK